MAHTSFIGRAWLPIVLVLAALLPALFLGQSYLVAERKQTCANNLRRIGQALQMYAQDNDGNYPQIQLWYEANSRRATPFAGCPSVGSLPVLKDRPDVKIVATAIPGYALNSHFSIGGTTLRRGAVPFPATTILFCESAINSSLTLEPDAPPDGGGVLGSPATRHNGGSNYLFCDGHLKWLKPEAIGRIEEPLYGDGWERVSKNNGRTPSFAL